MAMSVAQRRLSSAARELRRRTLAVNGTRTLSDGSTEQLSMTGLLRPLDGALAAMSLAIVVTACALVIARLETERHPADAAEQVRAVAGAHLASVGGWATPGANRPRTLPPKPPPTRRAPLAPASRRRRTAASTAGVETS